MKKWLLFINYRRLLAETICFFKAARSQGYSIFLASSNLPDELKSYVNYHFTIKDTSKDTIQDMLEQIKNSYDFVGIIPITETSIEASAFAAHMLSLKGMGVNEAIITRNKSLMRQITQEIDHIKTHKFNSIADLILQKNQLEYPVIVKPSKSSGSVGVILINNQQELLDISLYKEQIQNPQYDTISSQENMEQIIVEPFLQGKEYSVEGYVNNGEIKIIGITEKETSKEYFLEEHHIFPAKLSSKSEKIILEKSKIYIKQLKLDNTSFHLEGKYKNNEFLFIEVAARPGGDYITSHLIPLALGYDFYNNLINISTDKVIEKKPLEYRCYAGIKFILAQNEGILKSISGIDTVVSHPWVETFFFENNIGDYIELPPKNFRKQRILCVISTAPSYQDLNNLFKWIEKTIKVDII